MNTRKHEKAFISLLLILTVTLFGCQVMGTTNSRVGRGATLLPTTVANISNTPTPSTLPEVEGSSYNNQEGFSGVYTQVLPSVVNIRVEQIIAESISPELDQIPFPFNVPDQRNNSRQYGLGSGFVWDQNGHIVTNNHVVENADKIVVTFFDGNSVDGEIVGTDRDSDLAVLKVEYPKQLPPPLPLADSTQAKVGQPVAAIGNPFGLDGTMTVGVISALGRWLPVAANSLQGSTYTIPDVIQTDAPINPGNSGGVLVDMDGRLIGVTTAIESSTGMNAGIGFVVPSVIVKNVVPSLIEKGFYEHPWIGISGTSLNSEIAKAMGLAGDQRGVLVVDVIPESPAAITGINDSDRSETIDNQEIRLGGDVIIKIDSQPTQDFEDLTTYLARYTKVGQKVTLTVLRGNHPKSLELTLGVRPTTEITANPEKSGKAWLGISGVTITSEIAKAMELPLNQRGVLIQKVLAGSPADNAGLRDGSQAITVDGQRIMIGGDVITAVGKSPVVDVNSLQQLIGEHVPGDVVRLEILRNGDRTVVAVTLGETH